MMSDTDDATGDIIDPRPSRHPDYLRHSRQRARNATQTPDADDVVGPILVELLDALDAIADRWLEEAADEAMREMENGGIDGESGDGGAW